MKTFPFINMAPTLVLEGTTAADLMTPSVVTIAATATVQEAVMLLTERNLSAVPVVDADGQSIGVVSRSDIVAHDCARSEYVETGNEAPKKKLFVQQLRENRPNVFYVENARATVVRDIMTPVVFSVGPQTPPNTVVDAMLSLNVHRLFVTNDAGALVGVISATDVLRHLHECQPADGVRAEAEPEDEEACLEKA
ncbi:MAG TPA: CBS domain-containing protein [Gemmataceae bacterium]|nr:CBS domain-containing protein [Gemmataceae bacterium]